ncbi:unnamed protein product, partial [Amoebophrya sp. A25]
GLLQPDPRGTTSGTHIAVGHPVPGGIEQGQLGQVESGGGLIGRSTSTSFGFGGASTSTPFGFGAFGGCGTLGFGGRIENQSYSHQHQTPWAPQGTEQQAYGNFGGPQQSLGVLDPFPPALGVGAGAATSSTSRPQQGVFLQPVVEGSINATGYHPPAPPTSKARSLASILASFHRTL